jgi:hypothetical protein
MLGSDLKEIAGGLTLLLMFVELIVWGVFVYFRQRRGNPLPTGVVYRGIALIVMVGFFGAIVAPILAAAQ